jgi:cysteine sulfinate desulfinase/cysteine desulfurase-like protein
MEIYYFNKGSTDYNKTEVFNFSDISYPDVLKLRPEMEELKLKYKLLVGASSTSHVIFNSGATESIANTMFWSFATNPYGTVLGTEFDHSSVKENAENFGFTYLQLRKNDIKQGKYQIHSKSRRDPKVEDREPSLIFLTHVDGKTGEILDVPGYINIINQYKFINEPAHNEAKDINLFNHFNPSDEGITSNTNSLTLQNRPLIALDCTQSILKLPIEMEKWGVDALFFSLHKLGGTQGIGVLIVDELRYNFKPLIKGFQQQGYRGGTFPMQQVLMDSLEIGILDKKLKISSNHLKRKKAWEKMFNKIDEKLKNKHTKLILYSPVSDHLFNTFLILTNTCPLNKIQLLAEEGIFIGNISACQNEKKWNGSNSFNSQDLNGFRITMDDNDDFSKLDSKIERILEVLG